MAGKTAFILADLEDIRTVDRFSDYTHKVKEFIESIGDNVTPPYIYGEGQSLTQLADSLDRISSCDYVVVMPNYNQSAYGRHLVSLIGEYKMNAYKPKWEITARGDGKSSKDSKIISLKPFFDYVPHLPNVLPRVEVEGSPSVYIIQDLNYMDNNSGIDRIRVVSYLHERGFYIINPEYSLPDDSQDESDSVELERISNFISCVAEPSHPLDFVVFMKDSFATRESKIIESICKAYGVKMIDEHEGRYLYYRDPPRRKKDE